MTSRRVLLAVGDRDADRDLGDALLAAVPSDGSCQVHRCADLEDLLVTAATGVAEAAVVSAYLPRLDREALARLAALGVAAVGLAADEQGAQRLRMLGVDDVLPHPTDASALEAAVVRALARSRSTVGFAHAASAGPVLRRRAAGRGRVVAVWGPTGAPGRSTVAVGLAAELAALGWPTLLVDADVYGGSLAAAVGAPEEAAGLAAACRAANLGALDLSALEGLVVEVDPPLSVLTGIDRADRWPELRPAAVEVVLELARSRAAVTVVDCGFALEQDEELSYDTLAPRRNGATLAVLADADLVVVVGSADGVGLRRLVTALAELREAVPEARTGVVCNRVRPTAVPEQEVRATLRRRAGVEPVACLPWDGEALDRALARGRPLTQVAPDSPLRSALQQLAAHLAGSRQG
jgi:Flp pilus assembly CpaE family ATPase